MKYRIKGECWLDRNRGLKACIRLAFISFLICIGDLAFAENSADSTIREGSSIETQVAESSREAELNTKGAVSDSKRLLITTSDSKLAPSPGVNSADWLKAILGLMAVVVLIFAIAWFVKRFTGLAVSNQQQMRIISAIPVGAKERIALIEVADKQILVGITQHNINLLHSFEEPVVNKNDKTAVDFSSRLQAILSKGTSD